MPALSTHESPKGGDEEYIEYSEYHLHTNSPAWAALFPLPDSPEASEATLRPMSPRWGWDNDPKMEATRRQNTDSNFSQENTASQKVPAIDKEAFPLKRESIYSDICYTPLEAR